MKNKILLHPAMLAYLLFAAPAAAQLALIQEKPAAQAQLRLFGDVKTVLDGQSTGPMFRKVEPGDYLAALGCASVHNDAAAQGEALVFASTAFVKSVDPRTSYTTERTGESCWGTFLAGLGPESKPAARYKVETTQPLTVDALYKQLHEKHGALIGVIGSGRFDELSLSAVKKAPAYGDPILGPKRSEYFHPTEVQKDVDVFFFGLSLRSNADATSTTRKVFYINPADELSTAGQSHTHCAILRAPVTLASDNLQPIAANTSAVAHVLTQSRLARGEVAVYSLKRD